MMEWEQLLMQVYWNIKLKKDNNMATYTYLISQYQFIHINTNMKIQIQEQIKEYR